MESSEFGEWLLVGGTLGRRPAGTGPAAFGAAGGAGVPALGLGRWCLVAGGSDGGLRVRLVV